MGLEPSWRRVPGSFIYRCPEDQDFSHTDQALRLGSYNIIHLSTYEALVSDSLDVGFSAV